MLAHDKQLAGLPRVLTSGDLPHALKAQKFVELLDGYSAARDLYVGLLQQGQD